MKLLAGIELDPSLGPGVDAAVGEAAVRPGGLLQILQTQLGLVGPRPSSAERVAWLYRRLQTVAGYWSASFEADPWGTASRLVRDRDALAMQGWGGQSVSSRWDALWTVTKGMPPGTADLWAAVELALRHRKVELSEIRLVDAQRQWPGAIARIFEALREAGVRICDAAPDPATATGDLAQARTPDFRPRADGTLQLIRPQASVQAAEDIAAYLAALREAEPDASILVVTPDATLDAALHRAGLPTTGAPAATMGSRDPALQLLVLSLQLLWDPPDPQVALEWLSLPRTPIPRRLAGKLARALRQWPAVGSEAWAEALAEHDFSDDRDPEAAQRRRDRTEALLTPRLPRGTDAIPIAVLRERIEVVAAWARALAQSQTAKDAPDWRRAGVQHQTLMRLLEGLGAPGVVAPLLDRLVDAATEAAVGALPYPAQAGMQSVSAPGALVQPFDTIVWWNFTRDAAPPVRDLGLTRAERAALAEAGVQLPTSGEQAMWAAQRWRRPLLMARHQLLLVSPRTAAPGEHLHPHPLWDEVTASIPEETRAAKAASLQVCGPGLGDRPAVERVSAPSLALPSYRARWDVPAGSLATRPQESPSGLGTLLGCSFRWALNYPLRIKDNRSSYRLGVGPREYGSLAHEILATLLRNPEILDLAEASQVQARASSLFDAIGPRRVATLFTPGHDGEREDIRLMIARSASAVVQWLQAHDLRPDKVEESLQAPFEDGTVAGQVDLLARSSKAGPAVVVDFKWGGRDKRRREIQGGTAYQLATYAYAAAQGGPMPEYGYFIVYSQLMVGRAGGPFDAHTTVQGPSPAQTWEVFARSCHQRLGEVRDGILRAPGGLEEVPEEPERVGDRLVLPPPCRWCSHDVLCGLAFADGEGDT